MCHITALKKQNLKCHQRLLHWNLRELEKKHPTGCSFKQNNLCWYISEQFQYSSMNMEFPPKHHYFVLSKKEIILLEAHPYWQSNE